MSLLRSGGLGAVFALAVILPAHAQQSEFALPDPWRHWRQSAPVQLPASTEPRLVRVLVPATVSRQALPGWTDLRLIDDTGREVPYVLHARTERVSREQRQARLLDVTYNPGDDTRATLDLGAEAAVHNGIEIETPLQEFDRRVAIEVSADKKNWRVLEQAAPIYRFAEHQLEGNQTVRYPDNTSRYLRLRVRDGSDRFPIDGVRVSHETKEEAELSPVELTLTPDPASPTGESWWTADGGTAGQPLSLVEFTVPQEAFHRPVRIRINDDGETWRLAASGDIYRLPAGDGVREKLRVGFGESRTRLVRVEVINRSDTPVTGATVKLYATPRRVVFRAEPGRGYRLIYGNQRAEPAEYEMARLTPAAALDSAAVADLGPTADNGAYADPAPWTERHPVVLWAALIAAVAVLGVLATRALRASGERGP